MEMYLDRRRLLGTALAAAFAVPGVARAARRVPDNPSTLDNPRAGADPAPAGADALPERGIHETTPATAWTDGFLSGDGEHGIIVYGTPATERIVINHHRLVLPNGSRGIRPPVLADRLDRVRDLALAGDYAGAQSLAVAGWTLRWTQPFHPAYELVLDTPGGDPSAVTDYLRVTDFRTGEISTGWQDATGSPSRHSFVSRAAHVVVSELRPATGTTVDLTLGVNTALAGAPASVSFATLAEVDGSDGYLNLRGTYPAGQGAYGYEGVTRVVATGGTVTAVGATIVVTGADRVLLLTRVARYEQAGQWDARPLQRQLGLLGADYPTLLAAHVARHTPQYNRASLRLDVSDADRALSTSELIARQNGNRAAIDLALLERLFDAGRYHYLSSSGILPPRLTGLWAGSWNAAWADDFTTDANINLQIAGGNLLDLAEPMRAYGELILGQLADWRTNATNLYGARGLLAPTRTDGEYGSMLHFDNGFPGYLWTGGADWLLYPLLEYYQVTGDDAFFADRLAPALMELALFYEDFLTRTDAAGAVVFVPTYSPENSPANTGVSLAINATSDVSAGRHALTAAVQAANHLGVEQGPGAGVQRWTALLARLPSYVVNQQGALAEWSWPGLLDRYNHRHVSHLYAAWPLHEINPEERPDLVVAARRALELRGDENLSAHGSLHRALAASRLKDGELVYANLRKILGNNQVFRSLMTSHNPNLETYNADAAHALPAVLAEALVYSRPGVMDLLPAVPEQLVRGTIRGVCGRNRVRVDELTWDLAAGTLTARLCSAVAQQTTLISRRGIATIDTTAALADSPLGSHARLITLPAKTPVTVTVTLPQDPAPRYRIVNRRSGKALDVAGSTPTGGGKAVQRTVSDAASQQWRPVAGSDGSYRLVNRASAQVLDCPGASSTQGTALDEWPDTASNNQWWRLTPTGDGSVTLVNVHSGQVADVGGGSLDDGATVLQWPGSGAQNQQWRLLPIDP